VPIPSAEVVDTDTVCVKVLVSTNTSEAEGAVAVKGWTGAHPASRSAKRMSRITKLETTSCFIRFSFK
jgi:hypothetical protein